jgi:hypothetical protein
MFQRLQSLYLIAASGLLLALFALPLAQASGHAQPQLVRCTDFPLMLLQLATLVVAVAALFMYRNRPRQLVLCIANGIALTVYQLCAALMVYHAWRGSGAEVSYSLALVFPALAAILVWMAAGRIAKDERLVPSLDRLR